MGCWGERGKERPIPHHRERSEQSPHHHERSEYSPRPQGAKVDRGKGNLARWTGSVPIGGNRSVGFDRDQARRDGPIVAAGVAKRDRLVRLRTNSPQTAKELINDR